VTAGERHNDAGEQMVLHDNVFVEQVLPAGTRRTTPVCVIEG